MSRLLSCDNELSYVCTVLHLIALLYARMHEMGAESGTTTPKYLTYRRMVNMLLFVRQDGRNIIPRGNNARVRIAPTLGH